ncbi:MAG: cupin domain-containing protein [Candidatus Dormibacteraeota bacterium]|nr:cupin domain-containing protein [Candidatus Dormibacteraeota bacterium]
MGSLSELRAKLEREAEGCYSWSNGPGDVYAEHKHPYTKILYCVEGAIDFVLPERVLHLAAGDRMELPAGTSHSARVGPDGCVCVEGRRRTMDPE